MRVSDRSLCSLLRLPCSPVSGLVDVLRYAPANMPFFIFEFLNFLMGSAPRAGKASKHVTPHPHVSLSLVKDE
jgi:hypothetical protein